MPLVAAIARPLARAVVDLKPAPRKKGARRRTWWHSKLLRNRIYKGSGSGTLMSFNKDTASFQYNPLKLRSIVPPSTTSTAAVNDLKPYVSHDVPIIKSKPPSAMDYLKVMQQTWNTETYQLFMRIKDLTLGPKAGQFGKWGA